MPPLVLYDSVVNICILLFLQIEELKMFIMVLLVFLLAYGVSSQGLLYTVRNPDWNILKDVFYFPYWQLYGEIFLEELESKFSMIH